jgi:hypothetical protein
MPHPLSIWECPETLVLCGGRMPLRYDTQCAAHLKAVLKPVMIYIPTEVEFVPSMRSIRLDSVCER